MGSTAGVGWTVQLVEGKQYSCWSVDSTAGVGWTVQLLEGGQYSWWRVDSTAGGGWTVQLVENPFKDSTYPVNTKQFFVVSLQDRDLNIMRWNIVEGDARFIGMR